MLAQIQGFDISSPDELAISPAQFIDFMNNADSCLHPIGAIYTSTVQLLRYSFWLAEQKATLPRKEYKELLSQLGWEGEEKAYLKVKAAFDTFTPYELAQIEPRTIFQIALNFKKYQSVIPQMKGLPQITQDKVRGFMKQCHKPRAKREVDENQMLTPVVEATSQIPAPVDLLIQKFQTANSWQEINQALNTHEEYKQAAWDALTPTERRRMIELTPPTVMRLSHAKRKGLIIDFRESREGVYQVKRNGCLFWEIVYEYRIEEFFMRL